MGRSLSKRPQSGQQVFRERGLVVVRVRSATVRAGSGRPRQPMGRVVLDVARWRRLLAETTIGLNIGRGQGEPVETPRSAHSVGLVAAFAAAVRSVTGLYFKVWSGRKPTTVKLSVPVRSPVESYLPSTINLICTLGRPSAWCSRTSLFRMSCSRWEPLVSSANTSFFPQAMEVGEEFAVPADLNERDPVTGL